MTPFEDRWGLTDEPAVTPPPSGVAAPKPAPKPVIPAGGSTDFWSEDYSPETLSATYKGMGVGGLKGGEDVGNTAAEAINWAADHITHWLADKGIVSAETATERKKVRAQVKKQIEEENKEWEKLHGSDPAASIGRVGGQVLATTPLMGPVGKGVELGGRLFSAAGKFLPYARDAIQGVQDARKAVNAARATSATGSAAEAGAGNRLIAATTNLGSDVTKGATYGGTTNAATSSADDRPVSDTTLEGLKLGAALGPAARVVKGTGKMVGRGMRDIIEPLTEGGPGRIADRFIAEQAAGGNTNITPSKIPGVEPTLSEAIAGGNPKVSSLERVLRTEDPNAFDRALDTSNRARRGFLDSLAGDPSDIAHATSAREAAAMPVLKGAFAGKTDTDVKSVVRHIDKTLAGPSGKRSEITTALGEVKDNLTVANPLTDRVSRAVDPIKQSLTKGGMSAERTADFTEARRLLLSAARGNTSEEDLVKGLSALAKKQKVQGPIDDALKTIKEGPTKFETDPEMLYGVRKSIDDSLSPLAKGTTKDRQAAASELMEVKSKLDKAIEKGAPGFKQYLQTYSSMSKPIDTMKTLQSLFPNAVDANGVPTLSGVNNAIKQLERARTLPGVRAEKSVPQSTLDDLYALKEDLMKRGQITQGKALGSDTVQNLATRQAMHKLSGLAHFSHAHPIAGSILTLGLGPLMRGVYGGADRRVMEELINRFTNPTQSMRALNAAAAGQNLTTGVQRILSAPTATPPMLTGFGTRLGSQTSPE